MRKRTDKRLNKSSAGIIASLLTVMVAVMAGSCSERNLGTITVGILPDVDSIPLIIADNNGYFKDEGLDVKIESFKSAMDRDAALQTGNIDGAVSDVLAAAFAQEGGFDVRITSKTDGSYKLLAGRDAGIADIAGLKGKSVAISKNTIIEYATDRMLASAGMSGDDIYKEVIPQIPTRLEMLNGGKVDAATLPEPLASAAMGGGARVVGSSDELGINPGVLIFTLKAINEKPDEIKAFYRAYNKAVDYLMTSEPSEYMDVLVEKAVFPDEVRDTIRLPRYGKASLPPGEEIASVVEWLNRKSLITRTYGYDDLVEPKFVR